MMTRTDWKNHQDGDWLDDQLRREALTGSEVFSESLHARLCAAVEQKRAEQTGSVQLAPQRAMVPSWALACAASVAVCALLIYAGSVLWFPADRVAESPPGESVPPRLVQSVTVGHAPLEDLALVVARELGETAFPDDVYFNEALLREDPISIVDPVLLADDLVERPDDSKGSAAEESHRAAASPGSHAASDESRHDLWQLYGDEGDETRQSVATRLFYLEQKSVPEIARILDCPNATVRAMLQDTDIYLSLADAGL